MATERTVWHEVLDTRREMHTADVSSGGQPMETWRPDETKRWVGYLEVQLDSLATSVGLTPGVRGAAGLDPRQCLLDIMAVCSAWVDAMDQQPKVGT